MADQLTSETLDVESDQRQYYEQELPAAPIFPEAWLRVVISASIVVQDLLPMRDIERENRKPCEQQRAAGETLCLGY